MIRRVAATVLALTGLLTGCAGLPTQVRIGPPPDCDITWTPPAPSSRGRLLLIAQSVPEASMIPCLGSLPAGWEFVRAAVDSSGTLIVLETDTFDMEVEVRLLPACDVPPAEPISGTTPDVDLYRVDDGRTMLYSFEGGCVTVSFPTTALADSASGRALFDEIHLMSRHMLRQLSDWEL